MLCELCPSILICMYLYKAWISVAATYLREDNIALSLSCRVDFVCMPCKFAWVHACGEKGGYLATARVHIRLCARWKWPRKVCEFSCWGDCFWDAVCLPTVRRGLKFFKFWILSRDSTVDQFEFQKLKACQIEFWELINLADIRTLTLCSPIFKLTQAIFLNSIAWILGILAWIEVYSVAELVISSRELTSAEGWGSWILNAPSDKSGNKLGC